VVEGEEISDRADVDPALDSDTASNAPTSGAK
jgi:hypothetical protein